MLIKHDGKNQDDFMYLIYYKMYEEVTWSQKIAVPVTKRSFAEFMPTPSSIHSMFVPA